MLHFVFPINEVGSSLATESMIVYCLGLYSSLVLWVELLWPINNYCNRVIYYIIIYASGDLCILNITQL
ncbi:hypothetical protein H8356DRAFT_1329906 [Neocallimastix lanati (nom. inval.)]|nr:hypothetical protein H8356DRAFT_1329906 [Neocallimastix sp. JGI-2020a]